MYKLCKTEQSAARQRELERGLAELMNTVRYEDITVSDLCQYMHIPRKSFYRYFSGKDGALHALIDHTFLEYEGFNLGTAGKKRTLEGELSQFFEFWYQHKETLDALARNNLSGALIERAVDYATSETVLSSRFLPAEEAWVRSHVVQFAICGLMSMMVRWHSEGYPRKAGEMAQIAARLISQPLFPNIGDRL